VAYVADLHLAAKQHAGLAPFSAAMLEFVLPIVVAWPVAVVYAHRARSQAV
jgi:hypothetical protein